MEPSEQQIGEALGAIDAATVSLMGAINAGALSGGSQQTRAIMRDMIDTINLTFSKVTPPAPSRPIVWP